MNIGITLVFFFISRMLQNSQCPWIVESLEDFLYYCCPECSGRNQSRDDFLQHALKEHPNAKNYLVPIYVKNEFDEEYADIDIKNRYKQYYEELLEKSSKTTLSTKEGNNS